MTSVNVGELNAVLSLDDQLTKKLDQADAKFKATGKSMDVEARLGLDSTALESGLVDAEKRARKGGEDIGDGLGDGIDAASPGIEKSGSGLGGLLIAGMAGAVAGGAALVVDQLGRALDREAQTANLGIQMGLSPDMARAAGELTGSIYSQAFGESLGEVNDALRFVGINMGGFGDKSQEEVEGLVKGVLTLADVFDQDLNQVTAAAGTLMKNGLARNGQEALDIITKGLQSPANKADDLLDTLIEYPVQFRKLGITGPMMLGLLSQGLQGGARDADTVADAFKELSIRAIDGSQTTIDAYQSLGLNAEETAARIAAGGPVAAEGVQAILTKLLEIEDPVERNRVGVELFGTKWEDMGAAVNGLDLSTAVDSVGDVEGAMTRATDATATNQAKVEEWRRSLETNVTDFIANSVIPWIDTMGLKLQDMGNQWDTGRGLVGQFHAGLMLLGDGVIWLRDEVFDPFIGVLQTTFGWIGDLIEKGEEFVGSDFGQGILGAIAGTMGAPGAVLGMLGSFDAGGVVPGPVGAPRLVIAHGGETFAPTHRMDPASAAAAVGLPSGGSDGGVQVLSFKIHDREIAQAVVRVGRRK